MAEAVNSEQATAGMHATSQLDDATTDSSAAMTAPGSDSLGSEMFPLFRANPREAHVDEQRYDGRRLESGGEPGEGASWDNVSGRREEWGP